MDVMEKARLIESTGGSIIHMEVGQPGTGAPQGALEALARALPDNALGYTTALGLPQLRARIAQLYLQWYGIDLSADRIIVTSGSSAGFLLAFTALFDTGARVALGEPGYPSYRNILRALDLHPTGIQTRASNRFQVTVDDLEKQSNLDGLLVASPANPTGTMLDHAAMRALIGHCETRDIAFVSDEIYHGLHYGARAVSALEISDDVVVINSFSKYFSMTGWRVGWMVVPEDMVRVIERLAQNMFICAPHASQVAALAALDCGVDLEANRAVYRENRALMLDGLPKAGFRRLAPPDGAFYIYADVSDITDDSMALADELLNNAGVSVTPGHDFDPGRGAANLRFSYARSKADIIEGLARLQAYMAQR